MNEDYIIQRLKDKGINPTANRIIVARELCNANEALSMSDLEARLGTVDKSSIFRALTTLSDHHFIHHINDVTGQTKYAVCKEGCHCSEPHHNISEGHLHFHCERCNRTICLRTEHIPEIKLPEGYHAHNAEMIITGLCPDCIKKYGCKL